MMRNWGRRVRGTIGMGLTWAAAWSFVGLIPRWLFGFNTDAPLPLVFGVLGGFAGVTFSAVLMLTEGRRRFDQMSLTRFAAWGVVCGLLLAAIFAKLVHFGWREVLVVAPTFALASAVCASATLAVARQAARRELPDIRGDTAELTEKS